MLPPRKVLFSLFLLLVFSSKLLGQTFNTASCGQDKTCFFRPTSCSTSENCDFLITFKATTSSKVDFELSGKGNWVAVGFSSDQTMPDTDILMCVSNPSLSGHYYAADRSTPARTTPTPSAVTIVEQAFGNGVTKCRISRDLVDPNITNFRDLNQEVFLLAAIGDLSGSSLQQHSTRVASNVQVNVTQVTSLQTREDEGQQGSFRIPSSCTSSADCDFLVTYQSLGEDRVVFEMSGRNNWAGVGFSDDDEMPDTDMLLCVSNQALSGHYYASGRSTPVRTDPTPSSVDILEQSFENGVVSCRISRELNPGINNSRDLNDGWFLLGAIGPLSGNTIGRHNVRGDSGVRIRVTEGGDATGDSSGPTKNAVLAHGIMMTLAWILFAFVGLFTARYMRAVWEPTEIWGNKAWFTVHRTLMSITVLLTIAATVVIFVDIKAWSKNAGPHPFTGIVAIGFALIQPIMAAFRPHPGAPRRNLFNQAHRIVGTIALVMAVVSIYFGLDTPFVCLGKQGLYAVITFYIGEFLVFVFELYLILSKRNKEKRSVSMATGDIPMQSPGQQAPQQPEMDVKEAMIRTMMFIFVLLLGAGVALSIILLLVLNL